MTRYLIHIEYDGTNYAGWQRQLGQKSIQESLEKAIFNWSGENVICQSAGRTDAGVHAISMAAHIDIEKPTDERTIVMATNSHLGGMGESITVMSAIKVDDDFNARFSCKKRYYVYRILNRPTPPQLEKNRVWWVYHTLDLNIMNMVSKHLIGQHDFSTFRAAECQAKSPIKTLDNIEFTKNGDIIEMKISAKSFLHHQVRNIIGTLEMVGSGKINEVSFIEAFKSCDRKNGGPTAPAGGLFFERAEYK